MNPCLEGALGVGEEDGAAETTNFNPDILGKSLALVQKMASSGYHADGNQI